MAKMYFQKFPFIGYSIDTTGELRSVTDILDRAKIRDKLKDTALIFYQYSVKDGETPEMIAAKLYGWTGYHWIVLLANNIIDPYYDWPQSTENLTATIRKKYGSPERDGLEYAYSTIHHYEDIHHNVIDLTTFNTLPVAERFQVSVYDWEVSQNEAKRSIILLDKSFVDQIDQEMDAIMKNPTV